MVHSLHICNQPVGVTVLSNSFNKSRSIDTITLHAVIDFRAVEQLVNQFREAHTSNSPKK